MSVSYGQRRETHLGQSPSTLRLHETLPLGEVSAEEIAGYRLLGELGRGASGVVYRARHRDGRVVALKLIVRPDRDELARFRKEARVIGNLAHPGIVSLYEAGHTRAGLYLVLELVSGGSLLDLIRRERMPARHAARLVRDVARALEVAHTHGVIHRDLKPANILLDEKGQPKIADFGLARELRGDLTQITNTGDVLGTPAYMAPEQARGDLSALSPSTDVYSLGATLFHLLTGQTPFGGGLAGLVNALHEPAPSPCSVDGSLDPALAEICLRCLEKDPRDRFETAGALAAALSDYLTGQRPGARVSRWSLWSSLAAPIAAGLLGTVMFPLVVSQGAAPARTASATSAALGLGEDSGASALTRDERRRRSGKARQSARVRLETGSREERSVVESAKTPQVLAPARSEGSVDSDAPATRRAVTKKRALVLRSSAGDEGLARGSRAEGGSRQGIAALSLPASITFFTAESGVPLEEDEVGPDQEPGAEAESEPELAPEEAPASGPETALGDHFNLVAPTATPEKAFEAPLTPSSFASYAAALAPSLDPAGHTYSPYYQANTSAEGFVSLLASQGETVLVAHSPRRLDAIDALGQATELGTFPADVTSFVRQGLTAFVATGGGDDGGQVYLQAAPGAPWQLSLETGEDSVRIVQLGGAIYALDEDGKVQRFRNGLWSEWTELELERDDATALVGFRGRLWVGTQSKRRDREGGRASLLSGLRDEFGSPRGRLKSDAKGDGEDHRVTALLEVGGQLFVSVGAFDGEEVRRGSLSVLDQSDPERDELVELVSFRDDAPLSLAHHEGTIFVGTRRGRLYHLTPASPPAKEEKSKKGKGKPKPERLEVLLQEERLPANQGVHSLLSIPRGPLLIGVKGLVGAEVIRREGRTPRRSK